MNDEGLQAYLKKKKKKTAENNEEKWVYIVWFMRMFALLMLTDLIRYIYN